MATPAANIPTNLLHTPNQQIIVDREELRNKIYFRESVYNYPVMKNTNDYFGTSLLKDTDDIFSSQNNQTILPHTKSFVKYVQKFDKEYNQNIDRLEKYSAEEVRKKFISSLSYFLTLKPNAFSIEISEDETLFYTIIKNDFTFYLDQYIDSDDTLDEEFVLTTFYKNQMGVIKSGNILSILNSIINTTNC